MWPNSRRGRQDEQVKTNRMGWAPILLLCLTLSVSGCFRRAPQKAEADKEADVVVLGAVGLCSATAAAEKGASVILIESSLLGAIRSWPVGL